MTDQDLNDDHKAEYEFDDDPGNRAEPGDPAPGEPTPTDGQSEPGESQDWADAGERGELRGTAADDRVRVQALTDRLRELEGLVGDFLDPPNRAAPGGYAASAGGDGSTGSGPGGASGRDPVPPVYRSLADFVTDYFITLFDRPTRGGRWHWCPQWWEHGEAVSRLTALWHAWEALHDAGGSSFGLWYRDHLDHQLPILMGPDGPFRGCSEQHWPVLDGDQLRSGPPPANNRVRETA